MSIEIRTTITAVQVMLTIWAQMRIISIRRYRTFRITKPRSRIIWSTEHPNSERA
jgi:hypothetical protein